MDAADQHEEYLRLVRRAEDSSLWQDLVIVIPQGFMVKHEDEHATGQRQVSERFGKFIAESEGGPGSS